MLQMQTQKAISRRYKWLFWLNIGLISTFFAEVVSGSDMFPYFHLWGIVMVVPLYALHCLTLVTLVFRWGRPTLSALYFSGTLFGLYEAYITKVLWNPPWNGTEAFILADIAVFEVLVLVFFWHAWMSFILPLLAVETWLTNSNQILSSFPPILRCFFSNPAGWLIIAVLGGFFVSINAKSVSEALLSGLGVLTVLGVTGWFWRKLTRGKTYTMEELLPDPKEFRFLVLLLAGLYGFTGFFLRPEACPSIVGHLTIWVLYVLLALLFWLALQRAKLSDSQNLEKQPPQWLWGMGILTFTVIAMLAESLFLPLGWLIGLIGWYGAALLGLIAILSVVWQLIAKKTLPRV